MIRLQGASCLRARKITWVGDQYYQHHCVWDPVKFQQEKDYKQEGIIRKMPLPTPNVDMERPDDQFRDHVYDYALRNGTVTMGWLWKYLKPLGLVPHPKELHNRLHYYYHSRMWGFKRAPLVYTRRNPNTWTDRTWILKINEHITKTDHQEFVELLKARLEENPLIDPTVDATVMWYYRTEDDCGFPHGKINGPVQTSTLLQLHSNNHITDQTRLFSFRTEQLCWMPFYKYQQLRSRAGEFEPQEDEMKEESPGYMLEKRHRVQEYVLQMHESEKGLPNYLQHLGYEPNIEDMELEFTEEEEMEA